MVTQFNVVYINNGIFNRRIFFNIARNNCIIFEGCNFQLRCFIGDHSVVCLGCYADHDLF